MLHFNAVDPTHKGNTFHRVTDSASYCTCGSRLYKSQCTSQLRGPSATACLCEKPMFNYSEKSSFEIEQYNQKKKQVGAKRQKGARHIIPTAFIAL